MMRPKGIFWIKGRLHALIGRGTELQIVDSVLSFLVPEILITDPEWRERWRSQQKENFLRYAGFFFLAVAIAYIANYFLFDLPMGLEPTDFWLKFRSGMAVMGAACTAFYLSPFTRSRLYKLPAIGASVVICYTQAMVTIWYSSDAWIFFYIFVMTTVMILGMNVVWSLLYCLVLCVFCAPILTEAGVIPEYTSSATIVTMAVTAIMRRTALQEVRNFVLSEENLAQQKRIADISNEFAERLQSFIPRVIADRMADHLDSGMSVVEASIEALKAKKKNVACLFTDIRGFTQGSKDLNEFIVESVLPEVTACSNAIEDRAGIPSKVGDLIFAYFDDDSIHLNVIRAISAGIEVARLNEAMNVSSSQKTINRYILISSGEAMVGNFGGLDTSVEITALGTPVNFLSRVDDITKESAIAQFLQSGDLVISESAKKAMEDLKLSLPFQLLDLDKLGLSIRDFPEVRALYKLGPTSELEAIFQDILAEVSK